MNRRQFIQSSSALTASALLQNQEVFASPLLKNIGIQLFSLPKVLEKDFAGGVAMLSQMGYREIEMYGPFPFSAKAAVDWWASVTPSLGFSGSGYFGKSVGEVRQILKSNKITVPSIHTDFITLQENMPQLAEAARKIGFTYVTLPAIPEENRRSLDDYKRTIDVFNRIGASAKKEGIRFAYHNHGYGMKEMEGQVPLHMIIEKTDPEIVYLEMDLYWTVAGGGDPISYLKKYPNRYKMMHVKNMKKQVHFSGDGGNSNQWIELFPFMTTADDGVLDLKSILTQAIQSGVTHFFVEQDMVQNPEVALRKSLDYLKKL
ncbi:MAG: sugar phosphate isomerase/epimerase [Bacteroidetes bacterium]|nr:sugar phosphate isomerase/epimerase [Bacteroidota bacterium]MBS1540746.1 sugar phosphate isomerase/epimerase [Bacteroidota bacterium]